MKLSEFDIDMHRICITIKDESLPCNFVFITFAEASDEIGSWHFQFQFADLLELSENGDAANESVTMQLSCNFVTFWFITRNEFHVHVSKSKAPKCHRQHR